MIRLLLSAILLSVCFAAVGANTDQDPPTAGIAEYAGRHLRFISPIDGQRIVAGDSLSIALSVAEGYEVNLIFVVLPGGMIELTHPFSKKILIDEEVIGEITFSALGKTQSGEMVASNDVSIEILSGDELLEIVPRYSHGQIHGVGCTSSLSIAGIYSSGIERDLTEHATFYSVVEGSDVVCVMEDGVVVGRHPGEAVVLVVHEDHELEVSFTVGDGDCSNNRPQAELPPLIECELGIEACLDASLVRDFDSCFGEALDPNLIQWTVVMESGVIQGRGYQFCFLPEKVGDGIVKLEVTDSHGATSMTMSVVVVR